MNLEKLEQLLEMATNDPAYRPQFYDELMRSELFVLHVPERNAESRRGMLHLEKDTQIKLVEFQAEDGHRVIPMFTSVKAIQEGAETDESYLMIDVKTLFEITKGASYILNPYSNYSKDFLPEEVEGLLKNNLAKYSVNLVEKDEKILVGQPKQYPHALVKALRKYFSTTYSVHAAYLVQIHVPEKNEAPHVMVGVKLFKDHDKTLRRAILVAQPLIKDGEFVDFMAVESGGGLFKGVPPFFVNSVFNRMKLRFLEMIKFRY